MDALSSLPYRHSIVARDLLELTRIEFESWLRRELFAGGLCDERVSGKIHEIVVRATPQSRRQLLELALQVESILENDLGDPVFTDLRARTAAEAVEAAVEMFLAAPLYARWENLVYRDEPDPRGEHGHDHLTGNGQPA